MPGVLRLVVIRKSYGLDNTIGELFQSVGGKNVHIGYTLEDATTASKIYGESAIPAGTYKVANTHSKAFGKVLPQILDVPNYAGVRIHGGNDESNTLGCVLLGSVLDMKNRRISGCAAPMALLIGLIDSHDDCTLEII